jgi:hypothetical protein
VARIRYELLRLATVQLPENFPHSPGPTPIAPVVSLAHRTGAQPYSPSALKDSPATSGCEGPAALVEVAPPGPHEGGAVCDASYVPLDRDPVPPPGHVVEEGPILKRLSRLERPNGARPVTGAEGALRRDVAYVLTPALDVLLVNGRVSLT